MRRKFIDQLVSIKKQYENWLLPHLATFPLAVLSISLGTFCKSCGFIFPKYDKIVNNVEMPFIYLIAQWLLVVLYLSSYKSDVMCL